jgi:hypothetical protein
LVHYPLFFFFSFSVPHFDDPVPDSLDSPSIAHLREGSLVYGAAGKPHNPEIKVRGEMQRGDCFCLVD